MLKCGGWLQSVCSDEANILNIPFSVVTPLSNQLLLKHIGTAPVGPSTSANFKTAMFLILSSGSASRRLHGIFD
jgi:hypothetical protein